MFNYLNSGLDPKAVWNYKIGSDLWHAANNFIEYFKYLTFLEVVTKVENNATKIVL